ncbi:hypothetical protein QYF61_023361 [Mycteria americana]|uniref:Uncharacterized protein n=1 Tax=Mycteria americana TaxID=33587 RepID=A0AAN7SB83_MYCAM|nr:hypothetical protein QYF61_023361 [Mycteria americana]
MFRHAVDEEKNANEQEFNFEKARLEVHKFGITGYKKQEQRIWEQERAIMLGAKPPKKEHVNYKTYQEKTKEKKTAKDDDKGKEHKGDSLKKKKKEQKERKAKRKKSVPSIWPAGQVGKFRDGTLILQSYDIKKIKSSKILEKCPASTERTERRERAQRELELDKKWKGVFLEPCGKRRVLISLKVHCCSAGEVGYGMLGWLQAA